MQRQRDGHVLSFAGIAPALDAAAYAGGKGEGGRAAGGGVVVVDAASDSVFTEIGAVPDVKESLTYP